MPTSLLSLPNELLLAIIIQAPTTSAALRLLQVNQRLRAVWLENSETIIDTVMRRRLVAYDDAYLLTRDIMTDAGLPPKCPPIVVHKLVKNAELATSAVARFYPWVCKNRLQDVALQDITGFYTPYYFLRRLVQACSQDSIHLDGLILTLHKMSLSELRVLQDLSDFMCNDHMSYEEQWRQGMLKDERLSEWDADMSTVDDNVKDEWHVADEIITNRLIEASSGDTSSESTFV